MVATLKFTECLALFFKLSNFCIIAVFSNVTDNSTCDSEPTAAVRSHHHRFRCNNFMSMTVEYIATSSD